MCALLWLTGVPMEQAGAQVWVAKIKAQKLEFVVNNGKGE